MAAICRKAMSLDATRRYTSPAQIADDIERWLADEPVSCHADSAPTRLLRWGRRHMAIVTGAAVLLVSAIVALSIGTMVVAQKNESINANFQLAKQAVDNAYMRITENPLLKMPGMNALRKELLTETSDYYRQFRKLRREDQTLSLEYAMVTRRLGVAEHEINGATSAIPILQEARNLVASVAAADEHERLLEATRTDHALATAYGRDGQGEKVQQVLQPLADRLTDALQSARSNRLEIAELLAETLVLQAAFPADLDDLQARATAYELAQSTCQSLVDEFSQHHLIVKRLARTQVGSGSFHFENGDLAKAREAFSKAYDRIEQQLEAPTNTVEDRQIHAAVAMHLGNVEAGENQWEKARTWYETSRDSWQALVTDYPASLLYRVGLGDAYKELGRALFMLGHHRDSKTALLAADEALKYANRTDPWVTNTLALCDHMISLAYNNADLRYEAIAASRSALRRGEQINFPIRKVVAQTLSGTLLLTGVYEIESGQFDVAARTFDDAVAQLDWLLQQEPDNVQFKETAGSAWLGKAMALTMLEQNAAALTAIDKALQFVHAALQDGADQANAHLGLNSSYFLKDGILLQLGRAGEANAAAQKARQFIPAEPEALYALARAYAENGAKFGKGKPQFSKVDKFHFHRYMDQAMVCLRQALDKGLPQPDRIANDPALISLWDRQDFQEMTGATPNS